MDLHNSEDYARSLLSGHDGVMTERVRRLQEDIFISRNHCGEFWS